MKVVVSAAALLVPALAAANPSGQTTVPTLPGTTEVVGGHDAPAGKWPDASAMLFDGQQACTGTLIAPTVVLTAGHCNDASLTKVLIGTNSLSRAAEGETITIAKKVELTQNDITVVILSTPSHFAPRAIASGWASLDIKNTAPVAIVGYGAIDKNAQQFTNDLQEAMSTITDFDCSVESGCDQFELGAGGAGIDSCNGDSGGPLYLQTSYGDFLVGVTSRAYSDATTACGGGGIYGRPDEVLAAIETAAGVPVTHGPEPTPSEKLVAIRGGAGEVVLDANDPKSDSHTFAIATQPAMGTAAVSSSGSLRVCANSNATVGNDIDFVVVTTTDTNDSTRKITTKIPISIATNDPETGTCDPTAFSTGDGGGCCDSGRGAIGGLPLALGVLVVLRRRRRA